MAIRVECENCGKVLNAKDDAAGKKAKCPGCGEILSIPDSQVVDAEMARDDDYGSMANSNDAELRPCPACGEEIKKNALKCRYCGEVFDASLKRRSRSGGKGRIADLGKRFLGAMADGLVGFAFVIPGAIIVQVGGGEEGLDRSEPMALAGIGLIVLGALAMLGINLYLLATRSQSIGKFLMKTQIRDYETNAPAGFVKCFLLRGVVNGIIGAIPCVGGIYSLVDILFVFSEDHRCLHDKIAGTYVVDISE